MDSEKYVQGETHSFVGTAGRKCAVEVRDTVPLALTTLGYLSGGKLRLLGADLDDANLYEMNLSECSDNTLWDIVFAVQEEQKKRMSR
jgi:hypothetical protein